jgi:hypothetical protein
MLVPYNTIGERPLPAKPTSLMKCEATHEVAAIAGDMSRAVSRVWKFFDAHPLHRCACPLCARCPHVLDILNVAFTALQMHVELIDYARPLTAAEWAEDKPIEDGYAARAACRAKGEKAELRPLSPEETAAVLEGIELGTHVVVDDSEAFRHMREEYRP